MILLIPAYKITQSKPGDQAADHLSNPVSRELSYLSCNKLLSMNAAQKLGISSVLLTIAFFIMPFEISRIPIGWVCGITAGILGALAARRGSKWWLILPGLTFSVGIFAIVMSIYPE
jgi:hypothetical protein